jgi:hypothetical protein
MAEMPREIRVDIKAAVNEPEADQFGEWAVIELMGHRRVAGYATEQRVAGHGFIRVDVHDAEGVLQVTQIYAPSAVYCIHPSTRDAVLQLATALKPPPPIQQWELPAAAQSFPDADQPY